MTNKSPFCASLRLTRTVFTRLMKKANNHLYSLPPIPGPQSLTHNPLTNMMIQSKTNNHLSLILNHLYGLHKFAFCILIFDFPPCLRAFCASLRLTRTVFTRLLKKAISMALWTKATLCVKSSLLEQNLPGTPSRLKTSMISESKNLFTPLETCLLFLMGRILRLIKDLRSTKDYVRKNNLFMQNKANFKKVKLNVNKVLTRNYVRMDTWSIRKTKPIQSQYKANSKPIQTQSKPIQSQTNPIQTQFKGTEGEIVDGNCRFYVCCFGFGVDVLYILIGEVLRLLSDVCVEKWMYGGEMQVSATICRQGLVCCK
ncbi:MAG: hypothetical protein WBC22_19265 [Sedimentisphaerales bacterium]